MNTESLGHVHIGGRRLVLAALAAAVLVVDHVSKALTGHMPCGPVVCPLENHQLMLGFGVAHPVWNVVVGVLGIGLFNVWSWRRAGRGAAPALTGAVVACAGMVANVADRVVHGHVRDFLAVPGSVVLNLADIAIAAGIALVAWPSPNHHPEGR